MSASTYQRILQIGIFASLGVIFLLFSNLLFPYISSKQLSFNILMELLLPFWLVLIWKFPAFRPAKSYITWGLTAFLAAILITSFTGIDFNLSFWGDVERLLGFFHIFHFFLFYLYIITVFRTRDDWYLLLSASVLVATIQAFIILTGERIGTIGNTAYVSGYMLFNIYFAVLLCLRTTIMKQWPFYISIILMLVAFFRADTSGAIIGLGVSVLLLIFLLGLFAHRRRLRQIALITFSIAVIAVVALFSQYNQAWFQENSFLKDLSVNKATFQTRWLSWEGAMRDFPAHPILGTGFGNYAIIFDRQFNPEFFNYSTTETYFDRAHNNLIDIVSTTGLVGLFAYLSIFIAALMAWLKAVKRHAYRVLPGSEGTAMRELLVMAALLTAYFIQNLAVFDSLPTYMGLMISLAYLIFITRPEIETEPVSNVPAISDTKEYIGLILVGLLMLFVVFTYNVRSMRMLSRVIDAYSYVASSLYVKGFNAYRDALAINSPLVRDARTTVINIVISNPTIFQYFSPDNYKEGIDFVEAELEKNLAYNPNDSLAQMQAAQIYDIISRYYTNQPSLFAQYSDKAVEAIDKSIAASPRRSPVYFVKGQILASRGDIDGAEETFLYAQSLNPEYIEGHCQLANFYFVVERVEEAAPYVETCLQGGGRTLMTAVLKEFSTRYYEAKDDERLLLTYRALSTQVEEALLLANLAQAELKAGNLEEALTAAVKAAEVDPSLRPAVEGFIEQIESGFAPE
ncbi:MAG: O-antigen ligase family protein [bacterium]|nr:O-antigen ligase family protein [bacterium]